ncbi:hypothetical protein Acr_28g0002790 [Actinidia rufa]|uniref:Uncharacterized protein n=1 Tax=Actinidia rufa TaxID=165716 RepID=A0A7J0HA18_9ERIC|nr:hypothetical protein Acr_28g0002790 [Actinidia rufa]
MAPKSKRSTRKKKECWDLVVSTPEQSKGKKRKAVEDSEKGKKRKGESSSNINQERDPLYFLEDRDLERERGEGSSKRNEPMDSETPEKFETEMRAFMAEVSDSMKMLHTKIDNMAFRLVVVEKKIKNLAREVQKGKIPMEDDESEEEKEEENEDGGNEEEAGEKEKEGSNPNNRDDCSETESDASPVLIRRKSQRLGRLSKFSNTTTTALELSPSPSSSPSTPIHAPHTSSPPPL